jgi:hypothetical protein
MTTIKYNIDNKHTEKAIMRVSPRSNYELVRGAFVLSTLKHI